MGCTWTGRAQNRWGAGWVSALGHKCSVCRVGGSQAFDLNSKGRFCSEPHKGPIVQTLGIKQHMTPQHRCDELGRRREPRDHSLHRHETIGDLSGWPQG